MKERALEDLRQAVRRERQLARDACTTGLAEARGIKDKVQRARAELEAERRYRRDLQRIERANRAARKEIHRPTRAERRRESDDEVRGNVSPELVGLWERVKGGIRGSDRMTRTEAFLQYAHDNPNEVLEVLEDGTGRLDPGARSEGAEGSPGPPTTEAAAYLRRARGRTVLRKPPGFAAKGDATHAARRDGTRSTPRESWASTRSPS